MDKPNINFSFVRIMTALERVREGIMNPAMLWHAILYCMFTGAIITAVFAYLTFVWATNEEGAGATKNFATTTYALGELKEVISSYQEKEDEHRTLLRTKPVAPEYARGSGVRITPLENLIGEEATTSMP